MAYRELVEYIKKTQGQGYSEDLIMRALVAKGWAKHDIKAAYDIVNQEKFKPMQGEAAKTKQEIVQEKQVEAKQEQVASKGFSTSAAWIRCLSSPRTALSNARYFASFPRAFKSLVASYLVGAVILLAIFYFGAAHLLSKLAGNIADPLLTLSVQFALGVTVGGVISWLVQATALNFVAWLAAKFLLKGKSSFAQQLYLSSIAFGTTTLMFCAAFALTVASVLFETPGVPPFYLGDFAIPVITLVAAAFSLLALLYSAYVHVAAVKISHDFSSVKALIAILIAVIALLILSTAVLGTNVNEIASNTVGGLGISNDALANLTTGFKHATSASPLPGGLAEEPGQLIE